MSEHQRHDAQTFEDRIDWVLAHPGMSDWVKDALLAARDRDPIDVLNELEMLRHLLAPRAQARIDAMFPQNS